MRYAVCLECRSSVDSCWRWCPECGSLALLDPEGAGAGGADRPVDDYSVEWELDWPGPDWPGLHWPDPGRYGGQPPVGSPA